MEVPGMALLESNTLRNCNIARHDHVVLRIESKDMYRRAMDLGCCKDGLMPRSGVSWPFGCFGVDAF